MTLRHLKIFQQVCNEGSITKAAAALGMTQPSVSVAIGELEEYYQVKLFDRISRRLQLTPAGEKLLGYANTILMQFNESVNVIRESDVRKSLKVGIATSFASCCGPSIIRRFQLARPDVNLLIYAYSATEIMNRVGKFDVDLGIIDFTPPENMQSIYLKSDKYVLLCEKEFSRCIPHPVTIESMRKIPLILPNTPNNLHQPLRDWMERNGLMENIIMFTSGAHTMAVTVEAGIAALPILSSLAKERELRYPNSTYVEIENAPGMDFNIVMPKGKTVDPTIQTFIDIIQEVVAESLQR